MPSSFPFPAITDDEIFELLEVQNLRLDKVWSGVKEVLQRHMKGQCAIYNAANNRGGERAIKAPKDFYTAGSDLQEKPLPAIVVGGEMHFNAFGMGAYLGEVNTCAWVVTQPNMNENDIRDASLLAHFAHAILQSYAGGYFNAAGQNLWGSIGMTGVRAIPQNEKSQYGGFFVACDITQGPLGESASLYRAPLPTAP